MRKTFAFLLIAFIATACQPQQAPNNSPKLAETDDHEGKEYKSALISMIQRSERIVIKEHSYQYDAYDTNSGKSLIPNEVVYATRELSQPQKHLFMSSIEQMDPKTQDAFPACVFEPHHTIRFYAGGKLISTMEICFQCGQVEWDATKKTPPWSLYSGLAKFITGIGLQPERDWAALAKQHIK